MVDKRNEFFERLWAELESLGADPDHACREDWEEAAFLTHEALDASAWRPVSELPDMEDRNGTGFLESVCVQTFNADGSQAVGWVWRSDTPDSTVIWMAAGPLSYGLRPTHWRPLGEGPKP